MIALDTNVVLRLIVRDDPAQVDVVRALVMREPTLVPLTVTMECEWVLRSFYKYRKEEIATAIDALTDLGEIVFEQVDGVRWALERLVAGADFADMIHIVQSRLAGAESFATFDARIATAVGSAPSIPVRTLA